MPKSWEWVRLDSIGDIVTGSTPPKDNKELYGGHIPFYKPTDLEQGINTTTSTDSLTEEGFAVARQLPTDSILVTCIGATIGKTGMIRKAGTCNQQINAIVSFPGIFPDYIYYVCISDFMQSKIKDNASATTLPILNKNHFAELRIPLPPIEEQKRIVAAIEKWFSLIDTLESAKEDLRTSIEHTKSKILDLAIHGKLVPQDPNDEPAIELLKRLNSKYTPCDNAHYENLPKGWTVCALEEIIDYEQPQAYIVQSVDYKSHYKTPVLTAGKSFIIGYTNESEGVFTNLPVIIFDDFTTDSKFVDFPFKVKSSAMKILHVKEDVNIQYVCWYMSITKLIGDTHKRYWISEYSKLHIPIPPRKEQDRIINKVNELFLILDNISAEL